MRGPSENRVIPVSMSSYRDNKQKIREEAREALRRARGQLHIARLPDLQVDQSPEAKPTRIMSGRKSDIENHARLARKLFQEAGICMTPKKIGKNTWNSAINREAAERSAAKKGIEMRGRIKRTKHDDIFRYAFARRPVGSVADAPRFAPMGGPMASPGEWSARIFLGVGTRQLGGFLITRFACVHPATRTSGENPVEHHEFAVEILGQERFDALRVKANSIRKWKPWELEEMYQHFKTQHREIQHAIGNHDWRLSPGNGF